MPDDLDVALREAFGGEVRTRLPRLEDLARLPPESGAPDSALLSEALRDAHSLAGSAVVVGELAAARSARTLEAALDLHLQAPSSALPPAVSVEIDRLVNLLGSWR